ncbi:sirohydrochlorin cobaltochelatase [[Clostridium] leptum]|nr:sirohydrochlorin cobaltochelatase [[Clostridium] leptum]
MRQAVLAVHFWVNCPGAEKAMDSMDKVIKEAAPGVDFFRVLANASSAGKAFPLGLDETFCRLEKEGYTHIAVQSTYLLDGVKYREIKACVDKWKPRFTQLLLADPLLSSTGDLRYLAEGLNNMYPNKEGETLVIIGHGTDCFSNVVYPALQGIFHTMGRDDIVIGTIEGWPDFKNVIKWLSCIPSTDLHLVPLMMTAGKHACRDIAGEKDSWKSKLEQAEYQVHCTIKGLGGTPIIQQLMVRHLTEVMGQLKCMERR